jgi:hypothetical protein
LQIALALRCQDDPDFRKASDDDDKDLIQLLRRTLNSDTDKKAVLQLRGGDSERFLTLTYLVRDPNIVRVTIVLINNLQILDRQISLFDGDEETSRQKAHRLIVKLSESCGILPASLKITGVVGCGKEAISGGGLADIFQATYQGRLVALKRLRDFQANQKRQKNHQVGFTVTTMLTMLRITLRNSAEKHFYGKISIITTFFLFMGLTSKHFYQGCAWYLPGCRMGPS